MSEYDDAMAALKAADAAGDTEAAARLAVIADKFASTPGGAATGNPNMQRQGDKALRPDRTPGEAAAAIGGAGVVGGIMGAAAPEIAAGAGRAVSALPFPGARVAGAFLEGAAPALRSAGRVATAVSGAISGASGETAGQLAEAAGATAVVAEAARFAGGGVGAGTADAAKAVLQKYALVPALGLASKFKHESARVLLETLNSGTKTLSQRQRDFVTEIENEIRGGAKSDASLNAVGSIMGAEGQRLMSEGEVRMANSLRQAGAVGGPGGYPAASTELADIGGSLRDTITKRNEGMIAARRDQYRTNETARDALVAQSEGSGSYISDSPEYEKIVDSLTSQLDNSKIVQRSPDAQRSIKKVLDEISGGDTPVSFQAIDDVRRKLGEVFKGKPAEGYEALNDARGRELYARLTELQKQYAGGPQGPHAQLLEDYHGQSDALAQFRTKLGKKATALDQFQEGQFATDASALPDTYFKTRSSIRALQELTGNKQQVNAAALAYADKKLEGLDAAGVRSWMGKNSEWLAETGATRNLIDRYATRLEGAERSMRNAQDFVKQATADSNLLVGKALPAQRAVDLIKSGDAELWSKVTPVIAKSPQSKLQLVSAVRQVVAEQATASGTAGLFARNIRPFLEKSGIATKAEMDAVASGLQRAQEKALPEKEGLGIAKRLILQSVGGYSASAAARGGVGGYGLLEDMIPH